MYGRQSIFLYLYLSKGMGPRTFRSKAVELGDRSVWTDTPADKERKRMVCVLHDKMKSLQPAFFFCLNLKIFYKLNIFYKRLVRMVYTLNERKGKDIIYSRLSMLQVRYRYIILLIETFSIAKLLI